VEAIAVYGASAKSDACTFQLTVCRAPRLNQATVGLNAVVGFQRIEAVDSAPVEQVGGTKACRGKEQQAKRKKRKREGPGHVEGSKQRKW